MNFFDAMPASVAWALFAIVAALAVALVMLMSRLRQAHPQAWDAMGKPVAQIWRGNYKARWGLLKFLFNDAHAALNDSRVTALVWTMRALIGAAAAIVVVQLMNGGTA